MLSIRTTCILGLLIISICQNTIAQNADSLLIQRDKQFQEYVQFKENMGERTWINLVNLSKFANNVIDTDNQLVNYYLSRGIDRDLAIKAKAKELNLEIALLKRETEIQKVVLDEKISMLNSLLIIIGGISILFIAMLIFGIDRHIRFRNTRMELERTWAGEIEMPRNGKSEKEIEKVKQEIKSLTAENSQLKDQVLKLKAKIKEKEKVLDEELNSRKQLKEEIRDLITQIKSQ